MKRLVLLTTLLLTLLSGLTLAAPPRAHAQTGSVDVIGSYDTPGTAEGVAVSGSYAYVADGSGGFLHVINVSNPAAPTLTSSYDTSGYAGGVAVSGSYAYVADGSGGLQIINISNPAAPTLTSSYDTADFAYGMVVSGSTVYVADHASGLQIINVSNPAVPTLIGSYDTPGLAYGVAVNGSYAYVADGSGGLQIINISNPAAPTLSSSYDTLGAAKGVAMNGSYAYVADYDKGLLVINSNPAAPTLSGNYDTPGFAQGVAVSGSTVYVADDSGGLIILRFSEDQPAATPTHTPTTVPPTNTPTAIATTAPPTSTPGPTLGDPYETDNSCPEAKPLLTDGTIQEHTFHAQADTDWAVFQAISGTTYLIQAQTPPQSTADMVLEAYSQCGGVTFDNQGYTFSADVRLQIKAPNNGPFYLKLSNQRGDVFGSQVSYQLSVRALADSPTTGAVIIVAGKIKENDYLQPNIYHVTDEVYAMFAKHGYSDDRIYYLAPDLAHAHVDTLATLANLESAITIWAQDKVGPNQPLTLYLMDHGGEEEFYLNKTGQQWVTPSQLDSWLTRLEQAKPGVTVNLFIEACYSGSFIRPPQSVSKAGRVVIASADADRLAKASADGALFSDQLLMALTQKESLYSSFQTALGAVQIGNPNQNPVLDSNGNGLPNEAADLQLAAQRGFDFAGTFDDEQWPPYIVTAKIVAANSELQAEVQDDTQVKRVWAYLYPPSYQPPANTGNEMIQETLTAFLLTNQGNNRWAGKYPPMTESGTYRLVIYAEDDKSLQARPRELSIGGAKIYLPLIVK